MNTKKIWLVVLGFIHPLEHSIDGEIAGIAYSQEQIEEYKQKYKDEKYLDFYELEIEQQQR